MSSVAILGCAGYAGQETLDRVLAHPGLEPIALGSDSLAGKRASTLDPRLNGDLPPFVQNAEALAAGAEVVFVCLSHEAAAGLEPQDADVVVDLSGAHRLRDALQYPQWYGFEHPRPGAWSYGLPELFQPEPPLIANRRASDARSRYGATGAACGSIARHSASRSVTSGTSKPIVPRSNRASRPSAVRPRPLA